MKKFIFIKIALLFALICSFVFLSCSNDEETVTNQPEKGSPTAPNFSYGEYMYSQLSNVVFYLDSQRCLALKFKDIGNYKAFDVTSSECVNNVGNYVDYGLTSSTPYTEVTTNDGWTIKHANSRLIVTKENVITSSVVLKKKE